MQMPNITPAQIVSLVVAVLGFAGAFGLTLTDAQTDSVVALVGLVASIVVPMIVGDAVIRNGRSRALANPEAVRELERPKLPASYDA